VKSLTNYAYEQIRDNICTNVYKPGENISEGKLASDLGMSRTPVREALRILYKEGYVEIRNGTGVIISELSPNDIRDLLLVRKSLEVLASSSAVDHIYTDEIDRMELQFRRQLSDYRRTVTITAEEFTDRDYELHDLIIARCSNKYVKNIMAAINPQIKRFQMLSFNALGNLEESTLQHLRLLELIRSKDRAKLAEAIEEHIAWSWSCFYPGIPFPDTPDTQQEAAAV